MDYIHVLTRATDFPDCRCIASGSFAMKTYKMSERRDEFYIYPTSLASSQLHPNNTASIFTNVLHPSINMSGSWSVGLVDCIFNNEVYAIRKHDVLFKILMMIDYVGDNDNSIVDGGESVIYLPTRNIIGSNVSECIRRLERDMRAFLVSENMIVNDMILFKYTNQGSVKMMNIEPRNMSQYNYKKANISYMFAPYAAQLFGVGESYKCSYDSDKTWICPEQPMLTKSVKYINVYSDIVDTSHVGDTESNILDIFPFGSTRSRRTSHIIYKQVKTNRIDSISIELRDQRGGIMPFVDGSSTTCILHFKRT